MITAGIVGGSGYVAGELIRLLINHPKVDIDFIYSHSMPNTKVHTIHQDLLGASELEFTDNINDAVDVVFLCLGHGNSLAFLQKHQFASHTKIIDLGNDFRLAKDANFGDKSFVYGLVEANKDDIKNAKCIANPGCFATAIQLALLPLAAANELHHDIHVNAITGSTGAGKGHSDTSHFSWRNNNVSIYKAFKHQHLGEISATIHQLAPQYKHNIHFIPTRGDFTRGIFGTVYTKTTLSEIELYQLFTTYYRSAAYTHVTQQTVHLKQVVNTNNCAVQVQVIDGLALITVAIDNLIKGASGQAIQNMNLLFGLDETTGLQLKANYF